MTIPQSSPLGIYISIPFCRAKCSYCNFASGVFGSERIQTYVDRLVEEIRETPQRVQKWRAFLPGKIDSVYFGGGTPSLLEIKKLNSILQLLREHFKINKNSEITLECAPGQISDDLLDGLPGLGFNRVSLGVQSFVDRESAAVGRLHNRATVLKEVDRLRSVGIDDINIDLIAGLPHQTQESWQESLDMAIATGVPHLSVYMLDVDEDSRLGREMLADGQRYGAAQVPDDSTVAAMYTQACEQFAAAGAPQYEISNFARPGRESRHNLKYWTRQPYLGFGLDAHSFLYTEDNEAIRVSTTDDFTAYLNRSAPETVTTVSARQAIEEVWFLGLRLNAGVSLPEMEQTIGPAAIRAFARVIEKCEQEGLLEQHEHRVQLTQRGHLFANEVFSRFLGVENSEEIWVLSNSEAGKEAFLEC